MRELVIDAFAGGGGASTGIEMAIGRSPDVAINHDPEALALHAANHPRTRHYPQDVWAVDPHAATRGHPVGLLWLSPDCTFFSKARGGKPHRDRNKARRRRGLAWLAVRWAEAVRPRVIAMENVEEFQQWGPLGEDGRPCPERQGITFRRFIARLRNLGYAVEWRELRACDYGAPTIRKRFFLIARCDGHPIVWPTPTHGPHALSPYRTAGECIDWSVLCPSIFGRKKPLAPNTLRRIARGLWRYVIDCDRPFIVSVSHAGDARVHDADEPLRTITASSRSLFSIVTPYISKMRGNNTGHPLDEPLHTVSAGGTHHAAVVPYLIPRYGERDGQEPRVRSAAEPMPTIVPTQNGATLVAAFLAKHQSERHANDVMAADLFNPAPTITSRDSNALVTAALHPSITDRREEVAAFLLAYYGNEKDGGSLFDPTRTVTTKDRFGLVTVHGHPIVDIGMRMLTPRELYRAQGFPDTYQIDIEHNGKRLTKTAQVRMVGNSVSPPAAAALVRANYSERAVEMAA